MEPRYPYEFTTALANEIHRLRAENERRRLAERKATERGDFWKAKYETERKFNARRGKTAA